MANNLREQIDYNELELAVIDKISDLADGIEAFIVERGTTFPVVNSCLTALQRR